MTSFLDRMKQIKGKGPFSSWSAPKKAKERSATTVLTNRFDEQVWTTVRKMDTIDGMIYDFNIGDEHRDGTRKAFDGAPELVHDLFFTFYKAAAQVREKREVTRESYPVRHLIEEIMHNPRLEELQPLTAGDTVLSTIAVQSIADTVKEILSRLPEPPQPPNDEWCQCYGDRKVDPHDLKTCECQCHEPSEGGKGDGKGPQPPKTEKRKPQKPEKGDGEGEGEGKSGGSDPQKGSFKDDEEGDPQEPQKGGDDEAEADEDPDGEPEDGDEDEGEGDGDEGEGDPEYDPFDPQAEAEAAEQAELDWEKMFDDLLGDLDIDRLANTALQAAEAEVNDLDGLRRGIGLEDGEWRTMSPEKRLRMAEKLRSPRMKALSDIVGRMKRFALGVKATRINDVPHEIYNVELGNDIRRVLKSEFALLADDDAAYEFYRRFESRELMQAKMRGSEDVGKGPIVACVDKSGSMSVPDMKPFNWAMAVCEAMRRFAADEKRDFYVIFFGNNNDRNRFEFPGGEADFEKVLAFLSCEANGGTQFDGVLTEALQRASTAFDGDAKGKADIVFITDGQAALTPEWIKGFNEERERVGVRVYSVYIGGANDMRYHGGPVDLLQKLSDIVIPVSDLRPEAAKAIFERV